MLDNVDEKMTSVIKKMRENLRVGVIVFFNNLFDEITNDKENKGIFSKEYQWPKDFKKRMYQIDENEIFINKYIAIRIFYEGRVTVTFNDISGYNEMIVGLIEKEFKEEGFKKRTWQQNDQIFFDKDFKVEDEKSRKVM